VWSFAHWLTKKRFIVLQNLSQDTLLHSKKKAQQVAFQLISEKAEQEQFILQLLINKMGDRENKVSSNSVYLILLLLDKHPNMKSAVVKEIQAFLHRPNISERASYALLSLISWRERGNSL